MILAFAEVLINNCLLGQSRDRLSDPAANLARIFTALSIISKFSSIFSRKSRSRSGLSARNLLTISSAFWSCWPPIKAASQPLTKNIFRFRFKFGSSARDRARKGSVKSECLIELNGPNAASIQLSEISLLLTKSFQNLALLSAVPIPARAAYA